MKSNKKDLMQKRSNLIKRNAYLRDFTGLSSSQLIERHKQRTANSMRILEINKSLTQS